MGPLGSPVPPTAQQSEADTQLTADSTVPRARGAGEALDVGEALAVWKVLVAEGLGDACVADGCTGEQAPSTNASVISPIVPSEHDRRLR